MKWRIGRKCGWLLAALVCAAGAGAGDNLLVNGSFDDPDQPLKGWKYDYADTGNRLYAGNCNYVSVLPADGARRGVLRLHGTRDVLWATGQGVKVDSWPVPFEPGATYKLTAYARSSADSREPGPNCRMYIEGYRWRPGVKPHDAPRLSDLRKVYKQGPGNILYFGGRDSGAFSGAPRSWQKGECTFPSKDRSELAERHLQRVKFLVVHIVAIDGWDGDLLVDDVQLRRIE